MRRIKCIICCVILFLMAATGCQKAEPPKESPQPQDTPTTVSEPDKQETPPEEPQKPDSPFKSGVWMASGEETDQYYFFNEDGTSGSRVDYEKGINSEFSYAPDGDKTVFRMKSDDKTLPCKIVTKDETHIALEWDEQPAEQLTFFSPLDSEHFHFYTNEELCKMALEDYELYYGPGDPPFSVDAGDNGDGTVTIQIYQILSGHNSTAAWYQIDRCTGEGKDVNSGDSIDLTKGSPDVAIALAGDNLPENYERYDVNKSEFCSDVLLTAEVPISKFKVVALEYRESKDSEYKFNITKELFSLDALTPQKPLLLHLELPETIPNVGITYVDRNGANKLYYISASGADGSPLLTDIATLTS